MGSRLPLLVKAVAACVRAVELGPDRASTVGPRAPRAFLRAGATWSARGSASCRGKPASPQWASRCGVGWGLSCASQSIGSATKPSGVLGRKRGRRRWQPLPSRFSYSAVTALRVAPSRPRRSGGVGARRSHGVRGTRSGPSPLLKRRPAPGAGWLPRRRVLSVSVVLEALGLQLVAYGHQLVDFDDDAVLFGKEEATEIGILLESFAADSAQASCRGDARTRPCSGSNRPLQALGRCSAAVHSTVPRDSTSPATTRSPGPT